eukprot:TRINITY_DN7746_c0_g1_i1.p1 TRINITY_DN7746_c0_g1~~TRINITY_DN7746_c0_g1_i1.p1  ORF type:complete len:549 (+),score=86.91 TRINITY_DN7746_c0_g1_i1:268-1914(+)
MKRKFEPEEAEVAPLIPAPLASVSRSPLNCPVCGEGFAVQGSKQPLRLESCQHTICAACVTTMIRDQSVQCALCNIITQREAETDPVLPPNQTIISVVENLSRVGASGEAETGKCQECQEAESKIYCPDCAVELCTPCSDKVHSLRTFQSHRSRFTATQAKPLTVARCPVHPEKKLELFCLKCTVSLCSTCAFKHAGHSDQFREMSEGVKIQRQLLEETRRQLSTDREAVVAILNTIDARSGFLDSQHAALVERITGDRDALVAGVHAHAAGLLQTLDERISKLRRSVARVKRIALGHESELATIEEEARLSLQLQDFQLVSVYSVVSQHARSADSSAQRALVVPQESALEIPYHPPKIDSAAVLSQWGFDSAASAQPAVSFKWLPAKSAHQRFNLSENEKTAASTLPGTWRSFAIADRDLPSTGIVTYSIRVSGGHVMIGVVQAAHLPSVSQSLSIYSSPNCGWYLYKRDGTLFSGGPPEAKNGGAYTCGPVPDGAVVTVQANIQERTISFLVDGVSKGVAFCKIPKHSVLRPIVLLHTDGTAALVD